MVCNPHKLTEAFVKVVHLGEPAQVRNTQLTGLLSAVGKRSKTYQDLQGAARPVVRPARAPATGEDRGPYLGHHSSAARVAGTVEGR
jgi:hypothetical protein